jgi:hypothetical protein
MRLQYTALLQLNDPYLWKGPPDAMLGSRQVESAKLGQWRL